MTVPAERPLMLAVQATLKDELGNSRVGYGQAPTGAGWQSSSPSIATPFVGYAVLSGGSSVPQSGSVRDPRENVDQSFQVMTVGKTAEQADALRDRVRAALKPKDAVAFDDDDARVVAAVVWRDGQSTSRDADVTPPLFFAVDRYTAHTTIGVISTST